MAPRPRNQPNSKERRRVADAAVAIAATHEKWRTVRVIGQIIALAVFMLCTYPVAHTLSGKNTHVDVTVSLGIALSLGVTSAGTALWGNNHRKRANNLDKRNKRLANQLRELGHEPESLPDGVEV